MLIESIANLAPYVESAGQMALADQRQQNYFARDYKSDGSAVTKTDRRVEDYLFEHVSKLYPTVNILTEETARSFDPAKPYTFAIDPIDGTDVFSQGMHGWCVSIGLLDERLKPIAGLLFSPRLDLFFVADVGKSAALNGTPIQLPSSPEPLSERSNLMVSSGIQKRVDLTKLPGKMRNLGSSALHLSFPLIYPGVFGAIETPRAHIWDIAGAHAINLSVGFDLEFIDGRTLDYARMTDGSMAGETILSGTKESIRELRSKLTRIS